MPRTATAPPRPSPARGWMTVDDILTDLGIARRTWQEWRADGRTPKCRKLPNGQLRIRCADYDTWLNALPQEVA